jgi:prevent-host-death family protein
VSPSLHPERKNALRGDSIKVNSENTLRTISMTELRRQLSQILDEIEQGSQPIVITRYGKPVAVMLSTKAYAELTIQSAEPDFQTAYRAFHARWGVVDQADADNIWEEIRDKTPGKEDNEWLNTP